MRRGYGLMSFAIVFMASACGPSELSQNFGAASKKQRDLDSVTLELWARGPAQNSAGVVYDAAGDLERVDRTPLHLPDIVDLKNQLEGTYLKMFQSTGDPRAPVFFDWAGERAPWDGAEFKTFMLYHHLSKAQAYALKLFPGLNLNFPVDPNSQANVRLSVFADEEPGHGNTGYAPTIKTLYFFREGGTSPLSQFSTAHEADVAHHEFGHVLMHQLNPDLVEMPFDLNPDLDAIQEALADLYTAAMLRDEVVFEYTKTNRDKLLAPLTRTGVKESRSLNHQRFFPNSYVNSAHLDGSVIAAALNDYRKHLQGLAVVQLSQCTGAACTVPGATAPVSEEVAFDRVLQMALEAFSSLGQNSSLHAFGRAVVAKCTTQRCPNPASTLALKKILVGRGFYFEAPLTPVAPVSENDLLQVPGNFSQVAFGVESGVTMQVQTEIGYLPFPGDPGFANENGQVDPCEVLMIYPKIKNASGEQVPGDGQSAASRRPFVATGIQVELGGVEGFTALVNPNSGSVVDRLTATTQDGVTTYPTKLWGQMLPAMGDQLGEESMPLIHNAASRWYQVMNDAHFSRRVRGGSILQGAYFPGDVGWLVRAPSGGSPAAEKGLARFRVTMRVANSESATVYSNDLQPTGGGDAWLKPGGFNLPELLVATNSGATFCRN